MTVPESSLRCGVSSHRHPPDTQGNTVVSILLFHSALGLRPALTGYADELRAHGHAVHTPDLFDGEVFDDLADGAARRDEIGIPTLLARATAAADELGHDLVYAGMSMGTAPAQALAVTRPGARGLILLHGAVAPSMLGCTSWPPDLPVQVHTSPADPWIDPDAVNELTQLVPANLCTHVDYPDTGHLFTDDGLDHHDPAATSRLRAHVLEFLGRIQHAPRSDRGAPGLPRMETSDPRRNAG
jgi:dienelactone hydrolase